VDRFERRLELEIIRLAYKTKKEPGFIAKLFSLSILLELPPLMFFAETNFFTNGLLLDQVNYWMVNSSAFSYVDLS
jgi:hypothetical protein